MTSRDTQAVRDAEAELAATGPLRDLGDEVRRYPLELLRRVAQLHAERNAPVPDHLLRLPTFLGETALRGLLEGGYVSRDDSARRAIHAYAPTERGLALLAAADGKRARRRAPRAARRE